MRRVFILEDDLTRIGLFAEYLGNDLTNVDIAHDMSEVDKFKPPYDLMLLDHDLGGRQMVDGNDINTGSHFVLTKLVEPFDTTIIIHSYNPDGAANMARLLSKRGWKRVVIQPFGVTMLEWVKGFHEHARRHVG